METADQLHNRLMYEHFAWFDKNVCKSKEEESKEKLLPHEDPFFKDNNGNYCAFKHTVFDYWHKELLNSKRKLESVSLEEVWEECGVLTIEEYNKSVKNNTLTYPF